MQRLERESLLSLGWHDETLPRSLLVNFWYAHPVGHAVEALRYCLGYAGDELEASLLLNGATAIELGSCAPFVRETYSVDYVDFLGRTGDPDAALAHVPRDWDYVLDDQRSRQPDQLELAPGVRAYYQAAYRHFRARIRHGTAGSEPPEYVPNRQLRLELPTRRELPQAAPTIPPEARRSATSRACLPRTAATLRASFRSTTSISRTSERLRP